MPPQIASLVFAVGILGLFILGHERQARPSKALWISVIWLFLAGSRPVSAWLTQTGVWNVGWVPSADQYLEGSPLDRFVYSTLLAFGLGVLIQRRGRVRQIAQRNLPIVLFLAYCAASVLWSDYPAVAFKRWFKFLGDLVMVTIVLTDRNPWVAARSLFARASFLWIPLSILFIKYYSDLGRVYTRWEGEMMVTGVTTDKNTFGAICMFAGLTSLWRLVGSAGGGQILRRTGPRIAHSAVLAMSLWLLWRANSVTATACFLLTAGLLLVTNRPALIQKRSLLHLVVATSLICCLCVVFVAPELLRVVGRNPTLTGRKAIWANVLSMGTNPIVGVGFESFWLGPRLARLWGMFPGDGRFRPNESHNGYIEVYLNLGWVGLTLLASILLKGYRRVAVALFEDRQSSSLCLALFVVIVTYNLSEAAFKALHPLWIAFLWAVMAVPNTRVMKAGGAWKDEASDLGPTTAPDQSWQGATV